MKKRIVQSLCAPLLLLALATTGRSITTPVSGPQAIAGLRIKGADSTSSPPASASQPTPEPGKGTGANSASPPAGTLQITSLLDGSPTVPASGNVGLNHNLWVVLNRRPDVPADRYTLFLNGVEVKGLGPATDVTPGGGRPEFALQFKLRRVSDNADFWRVLLGSPKETIPVTVSLGQTADPCQATQQACKRVETRIAGGTAATFEFVVFTGLRLGGALLAIAIVVVLVWGHARTRTTLRDNLLPQLPPELQTYSLARWQMAFWFTLIFASFVFLFVLLWDYNTISTPALALMGISGATALASVAIDAAKDSPADAANRGLKALGLNTYADVLRVRQEIADRQRELVANPPAQRRDQLQLEIQDRNNILRTYEDRTRPFVSQGWFNDITTDINGPCVHRVQVVIWTVALGIVFVIGVYRDLAMPEFSSTLLALMGISGAGYVGFKFPEVNS